MRYPPDQKATTRRRILDAAGRILRRRGYHGSGVDAVMREAGLTHGGFYSHFRNKDALFADVVSHAAEAMADRRDTWTEGMAGTQRLETVLRRYLSPEHLGSVDAGCPVPPLISEVGRADAGTKEAFEDVLRRWGADLEADFEGLDPSARPDAALATVAACVGGMSLARAVDDPGLAQRLLDACRDMVRRAYLPTAPVADAGIAHTGEANAKEEVPS
ncbi:MAG: TetR/AcrR family transcriptional regulator [Acidobacteriota bacterium]